MYKKTEKALELYNTYNIGTKIKGLLDPETFCVYIANKLLLDVNTVKHWFTIGYVPYKHFELVRTALNVQTELDNKIKKIEVKK